jgi:hypothetical protein
MKTSKIRIFFSKLFSNIILKNQIVATVLYIVATKVQEYKEKQDFVLNEDI